MKLNKIQKTGAVVGLVVLVMLVLGGGAWLLFPQLPTLWSIKWDMRHSEHPELYVVPVDRQVSATVATAATDRLALSVQGLTFTCPFTGTPTAKDLQNLTMFKFPQGETLVLMDRRAEPNFMDMLAQGSQSQAQAVIDCFGAQNVAGKYALVKQLLTLTPQQVNWSTPPNQAQAQQTLLAFKIMTMAKTNDLFSFDMGGIKGFQYGNPDRGESKVLLDLYDDHDGNFTLSLTGNGLTQQQVDDFLRSIRVGQQPTDQS